MLSHSLSSFLPYPGHWDYQHGNSYWPNCGHPCQGGFHRAERSSHGCVILCAVQVIQWGHCQGTSRPHWEVWGSRISSTIPIINLRDHKMTIKTSFKWSLYMLLGPLLSWSPRGVDAFSVSDSTSEVFSVLQNSIPLNSSRDHTLDLCLKPLKWRILFII